MHVDPSASNGDALKPVGVQDNVDAEKMVREHIGWMLALAERLLRDKALAEDAVQEAFINAFAGLAKFEGRSSLKTWLHRITVNSALAKVRQQQRANEQSLDQYQPEFDTQGCRIEPVWPCMTSMQEALESDELQARVREQIDSLPTVSRIILQLRDIEGYSGNEVASILDISQSNVRVRLHRARAALKKLLEPALRGGISR
jgi:RNA polymerase sigma-70 factor (ECF subfamily)